MRPRGKKRKGRLKSLKRKRDIRDAGKEKIKEKRGWGEILGNYSKQREERIFYAWKLGKIQPDLQPLKRSNKNYQK